MKFFVIRIQGILFTSRKCVYKCLVTTKVFLTNILSSLQFYEAFVARHGMKFVHKYIPIMETFVDHLELKVCIGTYKHLERYHVYFWT